MLELASSIFRTDLSHRLLLWFDTPILAGVLIAATLPWSRIELNRSTPSTLNRFWVGSSLAAEIGLLYLLSRTGSRGPALAWICASLLHALLDCFRRPGARWKHTLWRSALAVTALTGFIGYSQFAARYAHVATDGSIRNRLFVLRNAGQLLLFHPTTGCGWGWSGFHYSQWVEPLELHYLYTGLLNDYLQLGVEFGLPVFLVVLSFAMAVILEPWQIPWSGPGLRSSIGVKAYGSLLILLLCAATTTLRDSTTIVLLLVLSIAVYRFALASWVFSLRVWLQGTAVAVLVVGLILVTTERDKVAISVRSSTVVSMANTSTPPSGLGSLVVLVDKQVLGALYGHTLRRMLQSPPFNGAMTILLPELPLRAEDLRDARTIVSFGSALGCLPSLAPAGLERIVVVHPRIMPVEELSTMIELVVLPEIDEEGVNEPWREFCREHNIRNVISKARGSSLQGDSCLLL